MITLLRKWKLLQAILGDASLSAADKVVAAAMLDNLNTKTGRLDPSAGNIASRIARRDRAVATSRQNLINSGWLRATRRRRTWAYEFAFDRISDPQESADHKECEPQESADQSRCDPQESAPQESADKYGKDSIREDSNNPGRKTLFGEVIPPAISKPRPSASRSVTPSPAFDAFWAAYPRRVGRAAAHKLFNKIVKANGVEVGELIAGAERYAAQCRAQNTEARFIKHPKTWLNDGCWQDEAPTAEQTLGPLAYGALSAAGLIDEEDGSWEEH